MWHRSILPTTTPRSRSVHPDGRRLDHRCFGGCRADRRRPQRRRYLGDRGIGTAALVFRRGNCKQPDYRIRSSGRVPDLVAGSGRRYRYHIRGAVHLELYRLSDPRRFSRERIHTGQRRGRRVVSRCLSPAGDPSIGRYSRGYGGRLSIPTPACRSPRPSRRR